MKIAGVLFDLYGTLFTYGNMSRAFSLWHQDLAKALKKLGVSTSGKQVGKRCKHFFSEEIPENERFTEYETRLGILATLYGKEPPYNWIKHTAAVSMNRWQNLIPVHPETRSLLKFLREKHCRVGVISNFQHAPHVRKVLRRHKLLQMLDTVIISGDVHVKKPDPKIFEIALERLGTRPEETLFVGDDPERDIRGAASVGMQTRLFQNGASLFELLKEDFR